MKKVRQIVVLDTQTAGYDDGDSYTSAQTFALVFEDGTVEVYDREDLWEYWDQPATEEATP